MNGSTMQVLTEHPVLHRLWIWALVSMAVAAATGLLYRGQLLFTWVDGLSLVNIRHAHSHLMFFSWVTPVPMLYAIARSLQPGESPSVARLFWIRWILVTGWLSFPFFLLYGYHPATVGSLELPLSVMLSGGVMIGWYGFAWCWWRGRRRDARPIDAAIQLFEGALLMLLLSSLGAWGVAVTSMGAVERPELAAGLTHLFLALFTNGWALLAALALMQGYLLDHAAEGREVEGARSGSGWPSLLLMAGAPLTFPLGMGAGSLSEVWLLAGRAGALLLGVGLLMQVLQLRNSSFEGSRPLRWSFGIFASVALLLILTALAPETVWTGHAPERIFYLHLLLLGGVSLTFLRVRVEDQGPGGLQLWNGLAASVGGMLFLLAGNTPTVGRWVSVGTPHVREQLLFWISVGIVVLLIAMIGREIRSLRSHVSGGSVSKRRNQVHRPVEQQKKADHVGDRVGIGTD